MVAGVGGKVRYNTSGTPALATAGSGDVLTGLIAGEISRLRSSASSDNVWLAVSRGAFLHGLAGELAEEKYGTCGVIADDLPEAAAECTARLKFFL